MLTKFISSIIILFVGYNIFVFVSPKEADEFADLLGIITYNQTVRAFKTQMDSTSATLVEIKDAGKMIDTAKQTIEDTQGQINEARNLLDEKVKQANQVVESVKETKESISKLTNDIQNLTTLTGSKNGSWIISNSGATLSGSTR